MLIDKMAADLNIPDTYLIKMARTASYCYKTYTIPKRTGGERKINHPSKELKAIQRWLLLNIIEKWPIHEAAVAYRRGMGIKHNAVHHVKSKYLLRMDLLDFFPSLTAIDIRNYMASHGGMFRDWVDSDKEFFVRIVCRQDKLTIGAPTSPALSNALCFDLDAQLTTIAQRENVIYTRYADDFFFSTNEKDILWDFPNKVSDIIQELRVPRGLNINTDKTRHSSKKGRRRITGIILSSDGRISIGRSIKRYIRRQVFRYDSITAKEKGELGGLIAFAQDIEPDIINTLILKYGLANIKQVCGKVK